MAILNVFANFFIDTPERFQRMQDSFSSFSHVKANRWVVNVRGRFAEQTGSFLTGKLGNKLVLFRLNSKNGWFYDTMQMLPKIDSNCVLIWVEDHICMCGADKLDQIVQEMDQHGIDQLVYTWWQNGNLAMRFDGVLKEAGSCIDYFDHDLGANERIQHNGASYLISFTSIFSYALFEKIVVADDPNPRRWPRDTPFDFEKAPSDVHWLPFRVAVPRQEIFASVDDDHGVDGYCLQSRGLYAIRETRRSYARNLPKDWRAAVKALIKPLVPRYFRSLFRQMQDLSRFLQRQHVVGFVVPDEPYFDPSSFSYFIDKLQSCQQYLEYGSGGSTVYAAKLGKSFTTVDSDKYLLKAVRRKIDSQEFPELGSRRYIHADIGLTKAWGVPVFTRKSARRLAKWKKYSDIPCRFADNCLPDLILIDGRFRVACALKVTKYLSNKDDWLMLVDDYVGRDEYREIERFATLDRLVGRMAVFRPMARVDLEELSKAINIYESDFD